MIRIYTFAVNRPDFLEYQFKTFKHFCTDDHQLVVVNDGRGTDHQRIAKKAAELGLECHTVEEPRRDTANYAHARSIKFIYDKVIRHDTDISMMLDGDMFLARHLSPRKWLVAGSGDYQLSALQQSRGHVYYMWPGLVFMDMGKLPDKDTLSFWPDTVEEQGVDVGGHSYLYLHDHPEIRVRWITSSAQLHPDNNNMENIPDGLTIPYRPDFYIEILGHAFIHYGGGTNWFNKSDEYHSRKSVFFFNMLDQLLTGDVSLPTQQG